MGGKAVSEKPMKLTLVRSLCAVALVFVIACSMKLAEQIAVPFTLALTFAVVFGPIVDWIGRRGLPGAFSALVTLALALLLIAGLGLVLEPVVNDAIRSAPEVMGEIERIMFDIQRIIRGIEQGISDTIAPGNGAEPEPVAAMPTVTGLLSYVPVYAAQILVFVGALYFMLLNRQEVYAWLARRFAVPPDRFFQAERMVSRYFLTIACINFGFGTLIGIAMALIGLPSPVMWGFAAALANFILYVGPAMISLGLLIAGIISFDGAVSVLPAAIYLGMNMMEGQFVTPTLVGRNVDVTPLLIFTSLVFWLWLWGPAGGIVAIPILVWSLSMVKQGKTKDQSAPR